MSLLSRLFGKPVDDRAHVQPLWHRIIELARKREWYADHGVADTVAGRFDAVTLVLVLVLLRMEREEDLIKPSVRLTELFVEDMDGQLRQSGIGDLVVGKHIGRLMGVLGGRLGALREALAQGDPAMAEAVARNMTLNEAADPAGIAAEAIALARHLDSLSGKDILAGAIAP